MGLEAILSWMLFYGLWIATNYFYPGVALVCYKCFESEDDPTAHRHFPMIVENAPRCTSASDRKMRISCDGYAGCKKSYEINKEPVPMEFVLYGCDRSSFLPGWYNDSSLISPNGRGPVAYMKCISDLCNAPSDESTQPSATTVPNSNTQPPYATTESTAFGKIGILLPLSNAMNFNWTAFINTIKSFKF